MKRQGSNLNMDHDEYARLLYILPRWLLHTEPAKGKTNKLQARVISEDTPSIRIHLPGAFAKTKKATNILRPAIDVSFLGAAEEFLGAA